MNVVDNLNSV
jgi:hypothetical protein